MFEFLKKDKEINDLKSKLFELTGRINKIAYDVKSIEEILGIGQVLVNGDEELKGFVQDSASSTYGGLYSKTVSKKLMALCKALGVEFKDNSKIEDEFIMSKKN